MGLLPGPPPRRLRRAGAAVTSDLLRTATRPSCPTGSRSTTSDPIEITHGEGRHVWDADGNRYLDFFGGILTTMTAHALPEVTKAVSEQAGRIIHSSTLYLNRPMVELAERIAHALRHPGRPGLLHHLRHRGQRHRAAARHRRTAARNQILAMRNSYHGRSFSRGRHHRQPAAGRRPASPRCRRCTCTAASAPAARTPS